MSKKIKAYKLEGRKFRFQVYHPQHDDPHYIDATPKPTAKLKKFARNQGVSLSDLLAAAGVEHDEIGNGGTPPESAPAQRAKATGKPWLTAQIPEHPEEDGDPDEYRRPTGDMRIDVPTAGMVIPQPGQISPQLTGVPTTYAELVAGTDDHPEASRGPEDWPELPAIDPPGKKVSRWGIMGRTAAGEMIIRSKERAAELLEKARAVSKKEHRTEFAEAFAAEGAPPEARPLADYIDRREAAAIDGTPEPAPLDCEDCAAGALGHPSGYDAGGNKCTTCDGTGKKPETKHAETLAAFESVFGDSPSGVMRSIFGDAVTVVASGEPDPPADPPADDYTTGADPDDVEDEAEEVPVQAIEDPPESAVNSLTPNSAALDFRLSARTGAKVKTYAADRTAREAIEAAIADDQAGAFLEWGRGGDAPKYLSVLDVDWHGVAVPDAADRHALILGLQPQPALAWLTKRGVHAVYENREDYYTGEELAAAGAVWLYDTLADTEAAPSGIEVLTRCRCPNPGAVCRLDQTAQGLRGWLRLDREAAIDPQIARYCDKHAVAIGNKYAPSFCPSGQCGGSGSPVAVLEDGIKCHRCAGHGRGPGNRGFWSWNRLVGKRRSSQVREMARAWVYADHAARVLAEVYPFSHRVLRAAWQCFLKTLYEPKDPRVGLSSKRRSIVRGYDGTWRDIRSLTPYSNQDDWRGKPVSGMPSIHHVIRDEHGVPEGLVVDTDQLAKLRSTATLEGWPAIMPSYGGVLWGVHNRYTDNFVHAAPWPTTGTDDDRPPMFRYIPADKREADETAKAWAAIDKCFPEIHRAYLKLLIVAKAYAESGVEVPMLFVLGPSGAGKTLTAVLAALLCGERPEFVTQLPKVEERVGQALMRSGMVVFDDLIKQIPKRELMPFLSKFLSASGGGVYEHRQPYMPFIATRIRSALVFTDTNIPDKITHNLQIGRRFVVVDLASIVPQWRNTAGAGGVYAWTRDDKHRRHADLIVSEVLDEYVKFEDGLGSFTTIAKRLGFPTVTESVQTKPAEEPDNTPVAAPDYTPREVRHHSPNAVAVRELFAAVIAGEIPTIDTGGKYGEYWLELDTDPTTAAGMFWHSLADGPSAGIDEVSGAVHELDIGAIIGAPQLHPVVLKLGKAGTESGFYFAMAKKPGGNLRAPATARLYNADIPNGVTAATPAKAPEPEAFEALFNLSFLGKGEE